MIELHCKNCGHKITASETYAGKKGKCPKCRHVIVVPAQQVEIDDSFLEDLTFLDVPQQEQNLKLQAVEEQNPEDTSEQDYDEEPEAEEYEPIRSRKLPWPIDIFLYPITKAGLTVLGIVVLIRWFFKLLVLLFGGLTVIFAPMLVFWALIFFANILVRIILVLYFFWYFCECIRESAEGNVRAPETISRTPGLGEMLWLFLRAAILLLIFLGPVLFCYMSSEHIDIFFVALLSISALFLPMSFLAFVMFDSLIGLNPGHLVYSIFKTFLYYPFIIILFFSAISLNVLIWWYHIKSGAFAIEFVFYCVVLYLLMVIAHLIGRFYWKNEEKLNWEC